MAPRGRPPTRNSRMDAAIEAMVPFGFSKDDVIAKMRELLEEYEGQYGFIELDAYNVLLEALIADQDRKNYNEQNQEVVHKKISNSNEILESQKVEEAHAIAQPPPPPPPPPPPIMADALPPRETVQPRRRKPCHGWISDDDDEDDDWKFINLPSSFNQRISPPRTPPTQPELTGEERNRRPKRKSRWDLRPEDMLL